MGCTLVLGVRSEGDPVVIQDEGRITETFGVDGLDRDDQSCSPRAFMPPAMLAASYPENARNVATLALRPPERHTQSTGRSLGISSSRAVRSAMVMRLAPGSVPNAHSLGWRTSRTVAPVSLTQASQSAAGTFVYAVTSIEG